jgi:hypothetical protein
VRVIDVTTGEDETLSLLVEDALARDLTAATVQVALGGAGDHPTTWLAASSVTPAGVGKLRVTLDVGPGFDPTLRAWLWVKLVFTGQTRYLRASNESISIR